MPTLSIPQFDSYEDASLEMPSLEWYRGVDGCFGWSYSRGAREIRWYPRGVVVGDISGA